MESDTLWILGGDNVNHPINQHYISRFILRPVCEDKETEKGNRHVFIILGDEMDCFVLRTLAILKTFGNHGAPSPFFSSCF